MTSANDGWLQRDGVDLHYVEWRPEEAEAQPPVLLLHGLSSNARYWERVARHLTNRRVIALDQRGHGLTGSAARRPAIPQGFAMAELVRDARRLGDELRLGSPIVVGHSWGATVALHVAASCPEFASALVFIDGPFHNLERVLSWDEVQRLMQPPLPRYRSFQEAVTDSKRDFMEAWGEDLGPFVEARLMPDGDEFVGTLTAPIRLVFLSDLYHSNPEALWPRVGVPALVLVAKRTFPRMARSVEEGIERLREIAPGVEMKRMDSPHDIPLYLPAQIAAEIERIAAEASAPRSEV